MHRARKCNAEVVGGQAGGGGVRVRGHPHHHAVPVHHRRGAGAQLPRAVLQAVPRALAADGFHARADCLSRYALPADCKQFECDTQDKFERQKRTPFQAALNLDSFSGGYHWTSGPHASANYT
ncbi:hypothetical protein HF086_003075 [Spodoptera exigua]|uniref:Uncharacterized protein n=1 Tax=Spodoptera exigua TaxID=7107 RepID=A0A922SDJ7_SPOEX|nr:hypothetical protein HF086_003075 [Spodoptera exigua]